MVIRNRLGPITFRIGALPTHFSLIFLFLSFLANAETQSEQPLKIITYNTMLVCVGPGCLLASEPNLEERAKSIGQWIKLQNADVVFLQEIFKKSHFEEIVSASGMPFSWFVHAGSGLAVLSKYPISKPHWFPYRWQGAYFQDCKRLFAGLTIGLGTSEIAVNGKAVMLGISHLLPRYAEVKGFVEPSDEHTPQRSVTLLELAEKISEEWTARAKPPMILAGDFNMNQSSSEYVFFQDILDLDDGFREATRPSGIKWSELCTYCSDNPQVIRQKNKGEGMLDYVFFSRHTFRPTSANIGSSTDSLSDHRPVTVNAQFSDGASSLQFSVPANKLPSLIEEISKVPMSTYCRFAPLMGWTQRSKTLKFLKALSPKQ